MEQRILVADDEPYIRTVLSRWLGEEGYECDLACDGQETLEKIETRSYALLLSDINMPRISGLELLALCRVRFPDLAVIMATAVDDRKTAIQALELGAFGYVVKPFEQNEVVISVAGALERRRLLLESRRQKEILEKKVRERTRELRQREEELAFRLVWAAERRDQKTGRHIIRIGLFSAAMAEALGWPPSMVDDLRIAAAMHDIGKIGVPDRLLLKPARLTPSEFQRMKRHAEIGAGILADSEIPLLQMAQEIALYHHENWDGSGYPRGLRGDEIPISARIVAVADVYDALCSRRPYKPPFSEPQVLQEMESQWGRRFDPDLKPVFSKILPRWREIQEKVAGLGKIRLARGLQPYLETNAL